jgi:hypothetical protein
MDRNLKIQAEEIRKEMEEFVIPYAQEAGLTSVEVLNLALRYGHERSKDWEWESNDRAFGIIDDIIKMLNSPINRFQRKYGVICLN